jgi:hypothetical protein
MKWLNLRRRTQDAFADAARNDCDPSSGLEEVKSLNDPVDRHTYYLYRAADGERPPGVRCKLVDTGSHGEGHTGRVTGAARKARFWSAADT